MNNNTIRLSEGARVFHIFAKRWGTVMSEPAPFRSDSYTGGGFEMRAEVMLDGNDFTTVVALDYLSDGPR